jgi:hypothetical protein
MDSGLPRKVIGMSNAEYQSKKGYLRRSFLHSVARFGGEAQRWCDEGYSLFAGSAATTLGSNLDAIVMAICEGKSFSDIVQIPPADVLASNMARRGRAYEEWRDKARAKGIIDVNADDAWKLERMVERLLQNPAARQLVEETTETQVSVFFELNGHPCAVRPDGCTPRLWWDLKSTSSTWDKLYRSVFDFGYAEQEWMYVEAAKAIGYEQFRMPFVFVQTMPPFSCHVFHLPEELVKEAGLRMARVMEEVRLRRETGVYEPADAGEITELQIPRWALRQEEEVVIV